MSILPIAFSGNFAAELWLWIRSNPIAFLTAVMICVTAYYAHGTKKYARIVSQQVAAQVELSGIGRF